MKDQQAQYLELLEELRHRYKQRYGVGLDDELLYLIIRMNELQVDLKKDIRGIERVTFKKGSDYFMYGLGKAISILAIAIGLAVMIYAYQVNKLSYRIKEGSNGKQVELKNFNESGDTTIQLSTNNNNKGEKRK